MSTPMRRFVLTLALMLAPALQAGAVAQEKAGRSRLGVEAYLDWETVADPQISPDGARIVYTRSYVNRMEDRFSPALWIMNADGSKNRFLEDGASPLWSPDGTRLAFLADGKPSGTQIFVRYMDAEGGTSQITHLTEAPANLRWSPDGRQIAFTMLTPRKESWKIDLPAPPKGASWTESPRIIESRNYRVDRQGFLKEGYTHIYVVPADGGAPRQITEGNWNVGGRPEGLPFGIGLDWAPEGREIIFDGLKEETGENTYRESHIYAVNVQTRDVRQITKERGPWVNPVISRDGKTIAFLGYPWTPQTYHADDLYVIQRDGTGMRKLTGGLDRDPEELTWAHDGSAIYFKADDRGSSNLYAAGLTTGVRRLTEGTHILTLGSISRNGIAVGVRSAPGEPGDVYKVSLTNPRSLAELTSVNDDVLAGRTLGAVEEIWYDSTGGTKVQGWIVKPPFFDPARKHPLILHIHGGPHAMYGVGFSFSFQHLAANDYVVLYTNPRGSTGYGTDFGNAIDDAYPSVDYDDLMAGVDAVVAKGYIDTKRMYATGVSGGGVLSSWIVGHTDRFAAAAVRAPVINWISFAGTTDITEWGYYRFHRPFWEDPDRWLRHSPLMYAKNVKTPVLLMTGELDLRTPMGQSEEYFQALRSIGVPATLIRFNGEYHGTGSKPSNFMRTQLYLLSWFGRHPE